jgi:type IV pilus assembly protein PilN
MIKINLLPAKRKPAKKLTPLQQQMIIGAFMLVISAGVMGFWWWSLHLRIEELKGEKAAAEATIARQENMLKEVKNVEEEEKKVKEKIDVIRKLEANQTGPVRLLDEVSKLLPKGVGLTALSEKGGQVDIEGTAFTNNDLVSFVDNLKASPYFSDVFLLVSEQAKLEGVDIYKYKLQFKFKEA